MDCRASRGRQHGGATVKSARARLDDLLDDLRREHRPGKGVDWHRYEAAKRQLAGMYQPGTRKYDDGMRAIVLALECGR
jgi:hypothetical protein